MSVITFVNSIEEKTGKTMSLVAIATNMALENNNRILIISTTNKEDKIKTCFFKEQERKIRFGIFGENKTTLDEESGIQGIAKIARSNKLTPQLITNYTKVVFKDRLEVILGAEKKNNNSVDEKEIEKEYIDLINVAAMYYDKVFVDLDSNLNVETRNAILQKSDLIIVNSNQTYSCLKKLKEYKKESELLKSPRSLILVGRYDPYSKYNSKNISRFLEERNQILTIPYNTLFFEAADEAGVPDLIINLKRVSDLDEKNKIFMEEVKRATENIMYRLQELQMKF